MLHTGMNIDHGDLNSGRECGLRRIRRLFRVESSVEVRGSTRANQLGRGFLWGCDDRRGRGRGRSGTRELWWRRVDVGVFELRLVVQLVKLELGLGFAVALVILLDGELGLPPLRRICHVGRARARFLRLGRSRGWFWLREVGELGRVRSEDLEAKLPQLFLGEGQFHIKDFEHLEFHLSNVPATEDTGDVRPITVAVGRIEGILRGRTGMNERKISNRVESRKNARCGEPWWRGSTRRGTICGGSSPKGEHPAEAWPSSSKATRR